MHAMYIIGTHVSVNYRDVTRSSLFRIRITTKHKEDFEIQNLFCPTEMPNSVYIDPLYDTPKLPSGRFEIPENIDQILRAPHENTARGEYDISYEYDICDDFVLEEEEEVAEEEENYEEIASQLQYFGEGVTEKRFQKRLEKNYMDLVMPARLGKNGRFSRTLKLNKSQANKKTYYMPQHLRQRIINSSMPRRSPAQPQKTAVQTRVEIPMPRPRHSPPRICKNPLHRTQESSPKSPVPALDFSFMKDFEISSGLPDDGVISYEDDPLNKLIDKSLKHNTDESYSFESFDTYGYENVDGETKVVKHHHCRRSRHRDKCEEESYYSEDSGGRFVKKRRMVFVDGKSGEKRVIKDGKVWKIVDDGNLIPDDDMDWGYESYYSDDGDTKKYRKVIKKREPREYIHGEFKDEEVYSEDEDGNRVKKTRKVYIDERGTKRIIKDGKLWKIGENGELVLDSESKDVRIENESYFTEDENGKRIKKRRCVFINEKTGVRSILKEGESESNAIRCEYELYTTVDDEGNQIRKQRKVFVDQKTGVRKVVKDGKLWSINKDGTLVLDSEDKNMRVVEESYFTEDGKGRRIKKRRTVLIDDKTGIKNIIRNAESDTTAMRYEYESYATADECGNMVKKQRKVLLDRKGVKRVVNGGQLYRILDDGTLLLDSENKDVRIIEESYFTEDDNGKMIKKHRTLLVNEKTGTKKVIKNNPTEYDSYYSYDEDDIPVKKYRRVITDPKTGEKRTFKDERECKVGFNGALIPLDDESACKSAFSLSSDSDSYSYDEYYSDDILPNRNRRFAVHDPTSLISMEPTRAIFTRVKPQETASVKPRKSKTFHAKQLEPFSLHTTKEAMLSKFLGSSKRKHAQNRTQLKRRESFKGGNLLEEETPLSFAGLSVMMHMNKFVKSSPTRSPQRKQLHIPSPTRK